MTMSTQSRHKKICKPVISANLLAGHTLARKLTLHLSYVGLGFERLCILLKRHIVNLEDIPVKASS